MGEVKWYKRDPDAALSGMMELNLEERGAYNTVLDLIYSRANKLPDDDRWISGWLRCDLRVWRRIKSRLIEAGKIYIDGGMIHNQRADVEIEEAILRGVSRALSAREAGLASARSRRLKSSGETAENRQSDSTNRSTNCSTNTQHSHSHSQKAAKAASARGRQADAVPLDSPIHKLMKAANMIEIPSDASMLQAWLAEGIDLETTICTVAARIAERENARGKPIRKLKYLDDAVREEHSSVARERQMLAEIQRQYTVGGNA